MSLVPLWPVEGIPPLCDLFCHICSNEQVNLAHSSIVSSNTGANNICNITEDNAELLHLQALIDQCLGIIIQEIK